MLTAQDVKVVSTRKMDGTRPTVAFIDLILFNTFKVSNARIVKRASDGKLFFSMPQKYNKKDKKWYDVVYPVTPEDRATLVAVAMADFVSAKAAAQEASA